MKTLEQQVQEIADREEIKELTAKYAHWVVQGVSAKVAKLFTDNGAFTNEISRWRVQVGFEPEPRLH
ncbi:MAG: hypothetical protein JO189_15610 [Deltaproteobacteria bacterium]|nr:hypothetical protein [Deltaproteobacteria bacterium]